LPLVDDEKAIDESSTQEVRRLVELVAENGLAELTVVANGVTITVKGGVPAAAAPVAVSHATAVHKASAEHATIPAPKVHAVAAETRLSLEAPMVGVYYRAPSPGDPPYINVGDTVRVGQVIGLIEAMKVYSEIPAEVSGRVTAVAADNGELVQQGQPLYYLETL
jgi:acetyl-CoA carboxylase biotin carboxyl carrier protein